MASCDVAIVGGGIIGGAIAFELAQSKVRVLLLDRQQPGREASWAAAGMLAPAPEFADALPLVPLARASLEMYPEFVAAVEAASGKRVGLRRDGALVAFFSPDAERELAQLLELHRSLNLAAHKLSAEEALHRQPGLNPAVAAAAHLPDEGSVDNRALTEAVLAAAQRKGAEIRAGVTVTALEVENDRCTGVDCGSERIAAGQVVVAAGCYSGQIGGLERSLPTRPVRGQMVALRPADLRLGCTLRTERGYLVPRNDGRILAGSTLESAGFEKKVTPAGLGKILAAAIELLPALADAPVVETWSGLRPDTPDHLPVLGPTDIRGLSIATGHYRNGILLAPITARLARQWLTGEPASLPLENFSPLRFVEQKILNRRA